MLHDWAFLLPPLCLAAALAQLALLPRLGAGAPASLVSLAVASATALLTSALRTLWAAVSGFRLSQLLGLETHHSGSSGHAAEFAGGDAPNVFEAAVLVVVAVGLVQALLQAAAMATRMAREIASRMPRSPDPGSTRPRGATR